MAKSDAGARTIYMPEREWKRLRVFAIKHGMTTSAAIRQAVEFAWFDSSRVPEVAPEPNFDPDVEEVSA